MKSVECYNPILNTWTLIADMPLCRNGVGVGVLDGVMYVIGGQNKSRNLKSVIAYTLSDEVWTTIADMHLCRYKPGNYNKNYIFTKKFL